MQVTHTDDHVTHAVMGGKTVIDFSISDSAEFFHILSSTLYSDQPLAVIREVLCNAWDAHKDAGITDKHIRISLDRHKLVVQDFGKGIPENMIGPIYGTYGGSTKKNDGTQTGGFGLGCKAPFAYTDNFEVISCHGGVKTIYRMSKSSAQVGGKPAITPLVSIPTTETGLTVTINMLTPTDAARFELLIKRIVRNGSMKALLNDNELPIIDFSTCVEGYLIVSENHPLDNWAEQLLVRYGDVIYPIPKHEKIGFQRNEVHNKLAKLRNGNYCIIFLAPPDSIAVTPSRESLSMQDHSINTLIGLMNAYISKMDKNIHLECARHIDTIVDEYVEKAAYAPLLDREHPFTVPSHYANVDTIRTFSEYAMQYLHSNYPEGAAFYQKDMSYRIMKMVDAGMLEKGLAQTFLKQFADINLMHKRSDWFLRHVAAPVVKKMLLTEHLDVKRLYIRDHRASSTDNKGIGLAMHAKFRNLKQQLPYLRKIVIITRAWTDLYERVLRHPDMKGMGEGQGVLLYHAPNKQPHIDEAFNFFEDCGYKVIDLVKRQAWEPVPERYEPKEKKPRKVGLVTLASLLNSSKNYIETTLINNDAADRITNPEFVTKISLAQDTPKNRLDGFDNRETRAIALLFGSKGGVCMKENQMKSYKDAGAVALKPYVLKRVCDEIKTNPRMQEYFAFSKQRVVSKIQKHKEVMEMIYDSDVLRNEYGLMNNLTQEDELYLYLFDTFEYMYRHGHPPEYVDALKHIEAIPLDPANTALIVKVMASSYIDLFNFDALQRLVQGSDPLKVAGSIEIFKTVLNAK